jgi:hypothetical protein
VTNVYKPSSDFNSPAACNTKNQSIQFGQSRDCRYRTRDVKPSQPPRHAQHNELSKTKQKLKNKHSEDTVHVFENMNESTYQQLLHDIEATHKLTLAVQLRECWLQAE